MCRVNTRRPDGTTVTLARSNVAGVANSAPHQPRASALFPVRHRGICERLLKPAADRVAGLALSLATLPIVLVIGLLVTITIGRPILYREERVGQNGRVFKVNRFRTMRVAANSEI